MDDKKIAALAKKNAAKAAKGSNAPKRFGKKYDINLADEPTDQASLEELERRSQFFEEMRKREF